MEEEDNEMLSKYELPTDLDQRNSRQNSTLLEGNRITGIDNFKKTEGVNFFQFDSNEEL